MNRSIKRIDTLALIATTIVMVALGYWLYAVLSEVPASPSVMRAQVRQPMPVGQSTTPSRHSVKAVPVSATLSSTASQADASHARRTDAQNISAPSNPALAPVHFHFDRSGFSREAQALLDHHAAVLLKEPTWSVLIQGHTDQEGSVTSNLRVGQRRAEAVRTYLLKKGVPADQLHVVSLGEFAPTCTEDTADCRARNRRVTFAIAFREVPLSKPPAVKEEAENPDKPTQATDSHETPPAPLVLQESSSTLENEKEHQMMQSQETTPPAPPSDKPTDATSQVLSDQGSNESSLTEDRPSMLEGDTEDIDLTDQLVPIP